MELDSGMILPFHHYMAYPEYFLTLLQKQMSWLDVCAVLQWTFFSAYANTKLLRHKTFCQNARIVFFEAQKSSDLCW